MAHILSRRTIPCVITFCTLSSPKSRNSSQPFVSVYHLDAPLRPIKVDCKSSIDRVLCVTEVSYRLNAILSLRAAMDWKVAENLHAMGLLQIANSFFQGLFASEMVMMQKGAVNCCGVVCCLRGLPNSSPPSAVNARHFKTSSTPFFQQSMVCDLAIGNKRKYSALASSF